MLNVLWTLYILYTSQQMHKQTSDKNINITYIYLKNVMMKIL